MNHDRAGGVLAITVWKSRVAAVGEFRRAAGALGAQRVSA